MPKPTLTALTTLTLSTLLSACGGGAGGTPTPSPTITSILLSPASTSVKVGQSTTLTATARDSSGQTVSGVNFTWKSSSTATATVASGVVTGQAAGTTQITASAAGVTSTPTTVTVTTAAPAAFTLNVSGDRLPVTTGTSGTLTVTVTRSGSFTGPVTVTPSGLPAGASSGPVTIPEGQTTATVTVSAAANAAHSLPTPITLTASASGVPSVSKTVTVTVRGPAGSLDTTFGTAGVNVTDFDGKDDYATATAVQNDGRVLLAGYAPGATGEGQVFALTRLTHDGATDPTFAGGKVKVNFGAGNDQAYALAVQNDGRIIAAGFAEVNGTRDFAAVRLNADGTLDSSFGSGGKVTVPVGTGLDAAYAVAVQPDGKIVLGGQSNTGGPSGVDFALVRLNPNGTLDGSFGSGGKVTTTLAGGSTTDSIYALGIEGGKITAVGGETDFMLARFNADGSLDSTFSGDGKISGLFSSTVGRARALAFATIAGQTRLVVVGNANNNTALARLNLDGSLDFSFAASGKVTRAVHATGWDEAAAVAVQADGKLMLGGWAQDDTTTSNFTALRYLADGTPDTGFDGDGLVIHPLTNAGKNDAGRALALQPDVRIPATRIIVAGERVPGFSDFAAIRLWD